MWGTVIVSTSEQLGHRLRAAREQAGLSARAASRMAGFSEGLWRQLELGYRQVTADVTVPSNPKASTVAAAANAVGLDLIEAFELSGHAEAADAQREIRAARAAVAYEDSVGRTADDASYVADRGPEPLPPTDLDEQALAERIRLGLEAMDEMRRRNGG